MKQLFSLLFLITLVNICLANNSIYAVSNIPDSLLVSDNTVVRFAQQQYTVKDIGKASA